MDCIYKPEINCCLDGNCSDSNCPSSHTCCWQTPDNNKPTLGMCVAKDAEGGKKNCDFKRGIPVKTCKANQYKNVKEGYTDDVCDNKFLLFYIFISILILFCLVKMAYRKKR
jgi:hypothetical protein